jgi:hypothetical protein
VPEVRPGGQLGADSAAGTDSGTDSGADSGPDTGTGTDSAFNNMRFTRCLPRVHWVLDRRELQLEVQ